MMELISRVQASTLALVLLLGFVGGACSTEAPSAAPASAIDTGMSLPSVMAGQVLRVAQNAEIPTLDPAIGYDIYSWPWERLLYETLVTYGDDATLVPLLATALPDTSPDGKTLTFSIRSGVNFVDVDGAVLREVVADDFVYALNRVLNPGLTPAPSPVATTFFSRIAGAADVVAGTAQQASGLVAPDSHTLVITLTEPDPTFLNVLAMPFASAVPSELVGTDTDAASRHPLGSGPYLLAEWTPSQRARFIRNPHYRDRSVGQAAEIDLALGVDPENQLQQVEAGSIDIMMDSIPSGSFNATVSDPRWASYVQRQPQVATNFLAMDTTQDGPLGNPLVRQAISFAIDRDNIVRIKNGRGVAGRCIYPPPLPAYRPDCNPYPYDADQARTLLAQAGFGSGFSTTLYSDEIDPDRQVAQAIAQDLQQVGIQVQLVPQPFDTLLATMSVQHQAPLWMNGWVMDFPDPADFIEPILTCASIQGGFNPAWYCNQQVDDLAAEARVQTDRDQRLATFEQIDNVVMADAPWVPLDYPETVVLINPAVGNFALHPVWRFVFDSYVPPG